MRLDHFQSVVCDLIVILDWHQTKGGDAHFSLE